LQPAILPIKRKNKKSTGHEELKLAMHIHLVEIHLVSKDELI
jgi:hypothetical protein